MNNTNNKENSQEGERCDLPLVRAGSTGDLWVFSLSLALIGVLLVGTGLLSTRSVLADRTPEEAFCLPEETSNSDGGDNGGKGVGSTKVATDRKKAKPLVDQVVVLLVDALRPDFAVPRYLPRHHTTTTTAQAQASSFSYIEDALLNEDGSHDAVGLVMVADAPTTTSQRLKALVTGSIPAFVEAGANFNSDAVEEDSLIWQLRQQATVLGDDTWLALFDESIWKEAHVYPSFDVRDLHSVDTGVLSHLFRVLTPFGSSSGAPPLVVGHFLGVDHAGHRFSARDVHMQKKISQLNGVLYNVTEALRHRCAEGRTMLLVFGDHGMTESGDHGGAAVDETDTFLFAELFQSTGKIGKKNAGYCSKNNDHAPEKRSEVDQTGGEEVKDTTRSRKSRNKNENDAVYNASVTDGIIRHWTSLRKENCDTLCRFYDRGDMPLTLNKQNSSLFPGTYQIDLVSTIASLLNVPVPFSNLGTVIPEVIALALQDSGRTAVEIQKIIAQLHRCNAEQIQTYIQRLNKTSPVPLSSVFGDGKNDDKNAEMTPQSTTEVTSAIRQWVSAVVTEARREWTAIQTDRLVLGCAILLIQLLTSLFPVLMFPSFVSPTTKTNTTATTTVKKLKGFLFRAVLLLLTGAVCWRIVTAKNLESVLDQGSILAVVVVHLVGVFVPLRRSVRNAVFACRVMSTASVSSLLQHEIGALGMARSTLPITILIFSAIFVRYGTVFANSFVVLESDAIVLILGTVIFLHFMYTCVTNNTVGKCSSAIRRRQIFAKRAWSFLSALFAFRVAVSFGLRARFHGTHIIATTSLSRQVLDAVISYGIQQSTIDDGSTELEHFAHHLVRLLLALVNALSLAFMISMLAWKKPSPPPRERNHSKQSPTNSNVDRIAGSRADEDDDEVAAATTTAVVVVVVGNTKGRLKRLSISFVLATIYLIFIEDTRAMHALLISGAFLSFLLLTHLLPRGYSTRSTVGAFRRGFAVYVIVWLSSLSAAEAQHLRPLFALFVFALRQCKSIDPTLNGSSFSGTEEEIQREGIMTHNYAQAFLLHLSSWAGFFALSQQCVVSSINWNAAFVGMTTYHMVGGGTLVLANTYAAFIAVPIIWVLLATADEQPPPPEPQTLPSKVSLSVPQSTGSHRPPR